MMKGKQYCLTWLIFSINMAPLIMKSIISAVLVHEESLNDTIAAYIDNLYVDRNIMAATVV